MRVRITGGDVLKTYVARVRGRFPAEPVTCGQPLLNVSNKMGVSVNDIQGKASRTTIRLLHCLGDESIVECEWSEGYSRLAAHNPLTSFRHSLSLANQVHRSPGEPTRSASIWLFWVGLGGEPRDWTPILVRTHCPPSPGPTLSPPLSPLSTQKASQSPTILSTRTRRGRLRQPRAGRAGNRRNASAMPWQPRSQRWRRARRPATRATSAEAACQTPARKTSGSTCMRSGWQAGLAAWTGRNGFCGGGGETI